MYTSIMHTKEVVPGWYHLHHMSWNLDGGTLYCHLFRSERGWVKVWACIIPLSHGLVSPLARVGNGSSHVGLGQPIN